MGFVATWQELWMLVHVGSGFGMFNFGLGRGQIKGGSTQAISVSIDTYGLVDGHGLQAHQGASMLVGGVVAEHTRNCSDDRST